MNNKSIFLFGAGFLIGGLLMEIKNNRRFSVSNNEAFPNKSSQTEPPKVLGGEADESKKSEITKEAVDPRINACKDKWIKFSQTVRFTSQEQTQSTYDNFMSTCVGQS